MFVRWKSCRVHRHSRIISDILGIRSRMKIMIWNSMFILEFLMIQSSILSSEIVIWRRMKFLRSVSRYLRFLMDKEVVLLLKIMYRQRIIFPRKNPMYYLFQSPFTNLWVPLKGRILEGEGLCKVMVKPYHHIIWSLRVSAILKRIH